MKRVLNKKIKTTNNRNFIDFIYRILTCIILFCIPIEPLLGNIYMLLVYLYIAVSMCISLSRKSFKITAYEGIYILFTTMCLISIAYSGHAQSSRSMCRQIIVNFLLAISISQEIYLANVDKDKIRIFIKNMNAFRIGTFCITLYLLLVELPKMGKWERLGEKLYENFGSHMVYSYCLIITVCFTIWEMFLQTKGVKKNIKIWIYRFPILMVLIYAAFVSGTRKTIICPIIFTIIYIIIKYRKKYSKLIISMVVILILTSFGYKFIMTNNKLYFTIGRRIESMLEQKEGKEDADGSMEERKLLRDLSIRLFKGYPVSGYGIHAFRYYSLLNGGPYLYAHCNYTELLADVGIIGFTLYYGAYIWIIIVAIRNVNYKELSIYIISFMVMNAISDYSAITYYRHYYLIVFVIFAKYLTKCKEIEEDESSTNLFEITQEIKRKDIDFE